MNAQCMQCGHRGERGDDVVIYSVREIVSWCEDCARIFEDQGLHLERLADQSGIDPGEAA